MKDFNATQALVVVTLIAIGIAGGLWLDSKVQEKLKKK